jgi:hypothetical protein
MKKPLTLTLSEAAFDRLIALSKAHHTTIVRIAETLLLSSLGQVGDVDVEQEIKRK